YIPKGAPEGVFVLLSSRKGKFYDLSQFAITLHKFSLPEAEKYLKDCLNEEQIIKTFRICDGLPGYLQDVRRQIKKGRYAIDLLNNPPEGFIELLEHEWKHFDYQ